MRSYLGRAWIWGVMPVIGLGWFVELQALAQQQPPGRAKPPQLPPGVTVIRDLEYGSVGGRKLLLDLYRPEKATGPLPLIVGIHGGGWAAGSKEGAQGVRQAGRGYAVACIGYRLSGEALFPAQIEDCKAAVRWLRANAGTYGLDPDRIGGHRIIPPEDTSRHCWAQRETSGSSTRGIISSSPAGSRQSVPCRDRPTCSRWTPTPCRTRRSSTTLRAPPSRG